ncbi:MAG: methionine--tRNA ligase [Alphaproteobacteria bacterium GM202ARS2]|nr:methionine--tRNA ligase [Alphaproteobacteria bacterium GM202ARS2]
MTDSFYLTTPIYYVNDSPHIGHAYTSLACDVLARFKRLQGTDVLFLTGTDEHGQKVEKAAAQAGLPPQQFADDVSKRFQQLIACLQFSPDDFIRTTEPRHKHSATALWQALEEKGDIYLDRYQGWYAIRDETFVAESDLIVDTNGHKRAPSGADVEWVEEESYFFRLSRWQKPLLDHYRAHPDAIAPASRLNEVVRFIESGLKDLSISRTTFTWGIPVPSNDKHVMYVWIDALANYLSALNYPNGSAQQKARWPADLHVIGKDILRFHAVYWPALLMSAGLPPPRRIFAHGWWTHEGQKISKSVGNVIDPFALVDEWGVDAIRYFLLREVPFGMDGNFSRSALITRINSDLANGIGNLSMRVLTLIQRQCDGSVPACPPEQWQDPDKALLAQADKLYGVVAGYLDDQAFHLALDHIWQLIAASDRYIDQQQPWRLKDSDPARMKVVLYTLSDVLRSIALVGLAFMPQQMDALCSMLSLETSQRNFQHWQSRLVSGTPLPAPHVLFPRVEPPK